MPVTCPVSSRSRIVVVGSGGRLGSSLVKSLEGGFEVVGLDRKQLDLASNASIDAALGGLEYDHLILTGALTAMDYCETHSEEAYAVNATGPGRIAEISTRKGAHVTYISTDMVFDGTKPEPYVETDETRPISVYGASKLAGEAAVMATSPHHLVVRVSWVYGPGRPAFPEWIIDRACTEKYLTLPADKIGCSTCTPDLITWLSALLFGPSGRPASGIFQLCNSSPCTWLEWGQFCIDTAREMDFPIVAGEIMGVPVDSVPAFVAKRPHNSAMSTAKFTQFTGIRPRAWRSAMREFIVGSESFTKYKKGLHAP